MPKTYCCWRCKRDIPMLTAAEPASIGPLVKSHLKWIKQQRTDTDRTLPEALDTLPFKSSELLFQRSGYRERSPSNFRPFRRSFG